LPCLGLSTSSEYRTEKIGEREGGEKGLALVAFEDASSAAEGEKRNRKRTSRTRNLDDETGGGSVHPSSLSRDPSAQASSPSSKKKTSLSPSTSTTSTTKKEEKKGGAQRLRGADEKGDRGPLASGRGEKREGGQIQRLRIASEEKRKGEELYLLYH